MLKLFYYGILQFEDICKRSGDIMEEITIIIGSFCFSVIVAIVVIYSCKSDNKSDYISTNMNMNLNKISA